MLLAEKQLMLKDKAEDHCHELTCVGARWMKLALC
jgi:hypothetical protein